jgi:hypothetical protein
MADELVFTVAGASAAPAAEISLAEAGLTERQHLQEWVLAHPQILGSRVMVVTFEFDRWRSSSGAWERDRLDVLGLDRSGRPVVAELKRDAAPDPVAMQAIKYAAMVSRFTPEILAAEHVRFLKSRGETIDEEEAMDRLSSHADFGLSPENLLRPRIVLVASSYPSVVTASVVWLNEMGLDVTLMKHQAYRTANETLITVSQLYPVPDVEEFTIAPSRAGAKEQEDAEELPVVEWGAEDYARLRSLARNPTVLAALELCSSHPGEPIPLRAIEAQAGRTRFEARGDLAGLTMFVKSRFARKNWPFAIEWAAGGEQQSYYLMSEEQARMWLATEPGPLPDQ